jgi:hypothetical protein
MPLRPVPGATNACNLEREDDLVVLHEQTLYCPCCGENIHVVLDLSVPEQSYVEDCSVCCRPILLSYSSLAGELLELAAHAEGGE